MYGTENIYVLICISYITKKKNTPIYIVIIPNCREKCIFSSWNRDLLPHIIHSNVLLCNNKSWTFCWGFFGRTYYTGCSLNIVFFLTILWFFWTLSVLLQRWCSTWLVCVHTLTPKKKQRKARGRNILKSSKKHNI